jgi:hypothetical protein
MELDETEPPQHRARVATKEQDVQTNTDEGAVPMELDKDAAGPEQQLSQTSGPREVLCLLREWLCFLNILNTYGSAGARPMGVHLILSLHAVLFSLSCQRVHYHVIVLKHCIIVFDRQAESAQLVASLGEMSLERGSQEPISEGRSCAPSSHDHVAL